jgi:hypothetical protein
MVPTFGPGWPPPRGDRPRPLLALHRRHRSGPARSGTLDGKGLRGSTANNLRSFRTCWIETVPSPDFSSGRSCDPARGFLMMMFVCSAALTIPELGDERARENRPHQGRRFAANCERSCYFVRMVMQRMDHDRSVSVLDNRQPKAFGDHLGTFRRLNV